LLLQVDGELSLNSKATIAGGNLTIVGLESDDAGLYECVATNAVASAVASTLLIVECKHGTPNCRSYQMTLICCWCQRFISPSQNLRGNGSPSRLSDAVCVDVQFAERITALCRQNVSISSPLSHYVCR